MGRTHGLRGRTVVDEARIDEWLGGVDDVRAELRKLTSTPAEQRAALRAELKGSILPRWFGWLDRLLEANRGGARFTVGETISVADVALY